MIPTRLDLPGIEPFVNPTGDIPNKLYQCLPWDCRASEGDTLLFQLPPSPIDHSELCLRFSAYPDIGDISRSRDKMPPVEEGMVSIALDIFWKEVVLRGVLRHDLTAYGSWIDTFLPAELRGNPFLQRRAVVVRKLAVLFRPLTVWRGKIPETSPQLQAVTRDHCLAIFDQIKAYAGDHGYILKSLSFQLGRDVAGHLIFCGRLGCCLVPEAELSRLVFGSKDYPSASLDRKLFLRLTGQTLDSFQQEEMEIG